MSEIIEDEVRGPTLAYVDKLQKRIEALEVELQITIKALEESTARIEALEAALREIETAPVRFDDGSLGKIDVPYGRGIIKGLESSAEIARATLALSSRPKAST